MWVYGKNYRHCVHETKISTLYKLPYFSANKPWAYLSSKGFFDGPICGRVYPGGGGLICGSKEKASEATDNIRQNENLYLQNE